MLIVTILFLAFHLSQIATIPVSIYTNAQFIPMDNHFMIANLSSIGSQNACICRCSMNSTCVLATYIGSSQYCVLYFAQLYEGELQLMTTDTISSVIYFSNKNISVSSMITQLNETVYAIWNTTAGGDSSVATVGSGVGNYNAGETASAVFDGISSTNYNSFGHCSLGNSSLSCGEKTGFYVTLNNGPSLLRAFRFRSGHYIATRDPIKVTIEGSNLGTNLLTLGSSWTLIYNGSTGLTTDPGRSLFGETQTMTKNSIWYSSYRLLVTAKRGNEVAAEYSEVQFFGY